MGKRLSGNNARQVLAVAENSGAGEELEDLLGKILSAAGLNLKEDILLLRLTRRENISFSNLGRAWPVRHVLLFGIEPKQLGLHFSLPLHQAVELGGIVFLRSHALSEIAEERQSKGRPKAAALWKSLRQLFPGD